MTGKCRYDHHDMQHAVVYSELVHMDLLPTTHARKRVAMHLYGSRLHGHTLGNVSYGGRFQN